MERNYFVLGMMQKQMDKYLNCAVKLASRRYMTLEKCSLNELPSRANDAPPLMLYMHIPFCEELCTYCSFHRVPFEQDLAKRYFSALRQELLTYERKGGYQFKSLYIGGGTPTVDMGELAETLILAKKCFDLEEISVETNPNHLDKERMGLLRDLGVGRLSVGVQSFDDNVLKTMERYRKYGSGAQIAERIKEFQGWFKTLNVDMIYNFPGQTQAMLTRDLNVIQDLKVDQVTFYPLMLATTTRKNIEKTMGHVCDETGRELYETIVAALGKEYRRSTAWCFSRESSLIDEYIVNYEEYVGVGSGAFGYYNGSIYANSFDIPAYIKMAEAGKVSVVASRPCKGLPAMMYDFMLQYFGLSLDWERLKNKYGLLERFLLRLGIFAFQWTGGIKKDAKTGVFTINDPYFGVVMMREFFTAVNNFRDYCRNNKI